MHARNNNPQALHNAIKNHRTVSLDAMRAVILQNPNSVRTLDETGHLPIHYACSRRAPFVIVQLLVELYPEGLETFNVYNCQPFHYACDRGASLQVMRYVAEQFPECVRIPTDQGQLPLHVAAAANLGTLSAVQFVYQAYPEAIRQPDEYGAWPFHLVYGLTMTQHRKAICDYLLDKEPTALFRSHKSLNQSRDNGRRDKQPSIERHIEIVKGHLQRHPEYIHRVDVVDGRVALHHALWLGAPTEIVKYLLSAKPDAIDLVDLYGLTPFHLAALYYPTADACLEILRVDPTLLQCCAS